MSTTGVKPGTGPKKVAGVSVTSKRITILVIVVAAIWFILVNTQRVSIYLWVPKVTAPLWLVLDDHLRRGPHRRPAPAAQPRRQIDPMTRQPL